MKMTMTASLLNEDEVCKVLQNFYGIEVVSINRQAGWSDATFHVTEKQDGLEYIFKLITDTHRSDPQIEAEIALVNYLASCQFPVPRIVPKIDGKRYGHLVGTNLRYRLQTYIKGRILNGKLSPELCRQFGDLTGQLTLSLQTFHHPFYEASGDVDFLMNSSTDPLRTIDLLPQISDQRQRRLINQFLPKYQELITNKLNQLVVQQIHCDLHGANLIADHETGQSIIGLIDFSDSRQTLRIIEPAIALFSVMAFAGGDGGDRVEAVREFLAQFSCHVRLNDAERAALPIAVIGIIVHAMAIDCHLSTVDPNYKVYGYLAELYSHSWDIVETLLNPNSAESKFFQQFQKKVKTT